jgi:hypothetical protein
MEASTSETDGKKTRYRHVTMSRTEEAKGSGVLVVCYEMAEYNGLRENEVSAWKKCESMLKIANFARDVQ